MKTTPILIFLFFLFCSLSAFSQYRTEFAYDYAGNGEVTIDLSSRPEGVYILSIRSAEDEHQYKIIKQ